MSEKQSLPQSKLVTTGHLREFLAMSILAVKNGDMAIDKAAQIHKLAGHINDSLYSEAKLAAFIASAGGTPPNLGSLQIGVNEVNGQLIAAPKK